MNGPNKLVFFPDKTFLLIVIPLQLIGAIRAIMCCEYGPRSLPKRDYLKCAPLGYNPASLANIALGWKGLSRTNTLAYCEHL